MDRWLNVERPNVEQPNVERPNVEFFNVERRNVQHGGMSNVVPTVGDERTEFLTLG
jgi:hypothetical protein